MKNTYKVQSERLTVEDFTDGSIKMGLQKQGCRMNSAGSG